MRTLMLTVDVSGDATLVRAVEVLSRTLSGLMLEGLDVRLSAYEAQEDDS